MPVRDRIRAVNAAGTPHDDSDDPDPKLEAREFFNGPTSGIRFESTTGTRFGVYSSSGRMPPTQHPTPRAGDGPEAGPRTGRTTLPRSATFLTVARPRSAEALWRWLRSLPGNGNGATLCAGRIKLVASFTRMSVKGAITELKDESGRTWETMSDEGRDKAVDSILLPDAGPSSTASEMGFYETVAGDDATAVFEDSRTANKTGDGVFRVQFVDDAGEALGAWEAFDLEGAFGATRTGSAAKPTLPHEVDWGGGAVTISIHFIVSGAAGAGGAGPIAADSKESPFTLTRGQLGLGVAAVVSDEEIAENLEGLKLPSLPTGRRGSTFASVVRSAISTAVRGLNDDYASERLTAAATPIAPHPRVRCRQHWRKRPCHVEAPTRQGIRRAREFRQLQREQETGGVFESRSWTGEHIRKLLGERRWDFRFRFSRNR